MFRTFDFPKVEQAYKPSGKISPIAAALMWIFGGVVSVIGGYLFGSILPSVGAMASTLGFLAALEFIIKVVVSVALGAAIAVAIYLGGKLGKNRSQTLAVVCGLTCGLGSCAALLLVSGGEGIGLFSGLVILCSVGFIPISGGLLAGEEPFCELHSRFMDKPFIRDISLDAEKDAMRLLEEGEDFGSLASLPSTDDEENHSRLILYSLPRVP